MAGKTFDTPDLLQIFPTFVWRAQLKPDEYQPLNAALLAGLPGIGAPAALASGENWQSDHGLHELAAFRAVTEWMQAAAENVLDYLKVVHKGIRITGCWANVNAPGASHRVHSHRNNYLSGVYYVQTHEGADTINFFDPRAQAGILRPPVAELTPENTEQVVLKVRDGALMVFPAWLQHSVDPNRGGRPRISLSFNIMFSGFTELMTRPAWAPGRRLSG